MTTTVTKSAKVIAALESGVELTGKQIESRYSVGNARALISSLRMQGYPVYLNKRTNGFGDTYPEIEGKVINAVKRAPTWIGDGLYADQHGRGYCVDSGQLGLVPDHMWKCSEERLNHLGRVVELEFDQFFVYDLKESGTINIAGYRIVTGPADYNGDPVEDEDDEDS